MTNHKDGFFEEIKAGFFGDFLISKQLINAAQLREALLLQKSKRHLRVGELLCELGHLSIDDLVPSLREYKTQIRLGELLVSNGDLGFLQLLEALDEQRRTGGHLGEVLVRLEFVTQEQVSEALELQQTLIQEELPA